MIERSKTKRELQKKEAWIKNVMKIYPNKTREETEQLFNKLFNEQRN